MTERVDFRFRTYQPADLQQVVDLYQATDRVTGDIHWSSAEMLGNQFEGDRFDATQDTVVVEHEGRIIGFSYCEFNAEDGQGWAEGVVQPEYWSQGIGSELIRRSEARVQACGEALLSPSQRISILRAAADSNTSTIHLLEEMGYQHVRSFYRMRIEFDQPVDVPPLPEGIVLRPFEAKDAHAIYEAHEEAFQDHWNHENLNYGQWQQQVLNRPGQDHSMWLIAYEGDEIAGVCFNRPFGDDDPKMAWIGVLAVRSRWRKRGLGMALLKRSFALFQARGYTRAGLGVDASSPTNANGLYERGGMRVYQVNRAYEKTLRGSLEG